tara:strand:- start:1432 stop:2052 length:621 start_codon:yes stop_codon:yes gene_type:complete
MANKKYAYYNKGNKIALIEKEVEDIQNSSFGKYLSPKAAVTDGLEIEYSYSPVYKIGNLADIQTGITGYETSSGNLKFVGSGLSTDAAIDYIVITTGNFAGLHKVSTLNASYWITTTKYNGSAVTDTLTAYTDVTYMSDEDFELDLTEYQAQAIVYYLKAKMAEDARDMDGREYFLRLFKKQIEKASSSRKAGVHFIQSFWGMRNG